MSKEQGPLVCDAYLSALRDEVLGLARKVPLKDRPSVLIAGLSTAIRETGITGVLDHLLQRSTGQEGSINARRLPLKPSLFNQGSLGKNPQNRVDQAIREIKSG